MQIMMFLSDIMIPLLIFLIIGYGLLCRHNIYEEFIEGAKDGFETVIGIMPTLIGLMVAVGILRASGFLECFSNVCAIKRLSVKNLHWEDGRPYCYTIDGHEKTWFLNLHFVDITKIFMEGVYENQSYSAHAKFVTYMLKCRGRLADIKHGNTKWQQKLKIKRSKNV